ncbi:glycoside hydrolase family 12 [Paraglaciecola aquimarina]|uniref:Glycoside hydrolase family 12 n=1 Tax=Paraglaciecola aquimarina TaxID=1235557 RepID=A0ABU3SVQ0_9ALTE|nr:glycoside hydrolase family 12 [Paraglaciecola aquimarina]MDU0354097.1 glycoside hydrolase family 12 [Paraglaciecola aquimarina]
MRVVIIILAISLFSCLGSDKPPVWVKPESTTINCGDYYSLKTELGIINNNVWNKHAAADDTWSQCLEKKIVGGETVFGWSWAWPVGRQVIYAYPQIKIGSSPWAPEPKFDSAFPLKISELKKLEIAHDVEILTNGEHNIATTTWLVSEPYTGSKPNPAVITAEIMIWTYATDGHFSPAGRKRGELTVNGITWEVWYQKEWDDKSGMNDNKWVSVSFKAKQSSMHAMIPALHLLNYAVQESLIPDNLYVADVELGNEIMSGSGITWVKAFSVHYQK